MKAKLEFDLDDPEDRNRHSDMLKADSYKFALQTIRDQIFRPARKHGYSRRDIQQLVEEDNGAELVSKLEDLFFEILKDYEISDLD